MVSLQRTNFILGLHIKLEFLQKPSKIFCSLHLYEKREEQCEDEQNNCDHPAYDGKDREFLGGNFVW